MRRHLLTKFHTLTCYKIISIATEEKKNHQLTNNARIHFKPSFSRKCKSKQVHFKAKFQNRNIWRIAENTGIAEEGDRPESPLCYLAFWVVQILDSS